MKIFSRRSTDNDPFDGIAMGDKVRDTLTGFTGVVIARSEYLTGCNQVFVLPASEKNNEIKDGNWFDVERVEKIFERIIETSARRTGADIPPPVVQGRRK